MNENVYLHEEDAKQQKEGEVSKARTRKDAEKATRESKPAHYNKLTLLMALRLAAPHTWPGASVLPTVFAAVYSVYLGLKISMPLFFLLMAAAVFSQSAVNTLNDWADYRKGTDTVENSDDPTDAVLVYDNPNPQHVFALGVGYFVAFLVCGIGATVLAQTVLPVIFGLIGALAIVTYSFGKTPISYLPLGELVSGVVMGGCISMAGVVIYANYTYHAGIFGPIGVWGFSQWCEAVLMTVPFIIGIGLINATQNTCDIERDTTSGRHTLAVLLGRKRGVVVYRVFVVLWILIAAHLSFYWYHAGFGVYVMCVLFGAGAIYKLLTLPLTPPVRGPAMGAIVKANLFINGAFILAIMSHCLLV